MYVFGSLLRAVVLAVVVAAIAGLGGALATLTLCAEGCAWANDAADIVNARAPGLPLDMATLMGALVLVGLVVVLTPRDPVLSLAAIFAALIAAIAFLVWLPRPEPSQPVPAPRTAPEPRPEPPLARALSCPEGSFPRDGRCMPCFVTQTERAEPRLRFDALKTDAYWQYARADRVMVGGKAVTIDAMINDVVGREGLCQAPALIVYGSASADGARDRNIIRARQRAENLAEALRRRCARVNPSIDIYALSLGQSEAAEDLPEDRAISIARIEPLTVAPSELTGALILDELGYALGEGSASVPLLERRDRFPRPWDGPSGTASAVQIKPRPARTVEVLAADAPASCRGEIDADPLDLPGNTTSTFDEGGLDPRMSLRQ